MEGWKDGRVEEGRVEGWKDGGLYGLEEEAQSRMNVLQLARSKENVSYW